MDGKKGFLSRTQDITFVCLLNFLNIAVKHIVLHANGGAQLGYINVQFHLCHTFACDMGGLEEAWRRLHSSVYSRIQTALHIRNLSEAVSFIRRRPGSKRGEITVNNMQFMCWLGDGARFSLFY